MSIVNLSILLNYSGKNRIGNEGLKYLVNCNWPNI
jgi:hypothetical protein